MSRGRECGPGAGLEVLSTMADNETNPTPEAEESLAPESAAEQALSLIHI